MKEMTGTCLYCGQEVIVEAENKAQADIEASKNCRCDNIIKRKSQLRALITDQCGEGAARYQLQPLKPETVELIESIGDALLEGKIEAANIKAAETIISIKATKNGCKISRRRVINIGSEV